MAPPAPLPGGDLVAQLQADLARIKAEHEREKKLADEQLAAAATKISLLSAQLETLTNESGDTAKSLLEERAKLASLTEQLAAAQEAAAKATQVRFLLFASSRANNAAI